MRQIVVAGRSAHVPSVGAPAVMEHASHAPPLHAELQHTPSTQNPEAQDAPVEHGSPFAPEMRVTKASYCPPSVVSKPPVDGKSEEVVEPATRAFPPASTTMA
jgi:hypothetical protein